MNSSAFTIVLNGALTIEQCVRHHAPHFDRYIVVEGAAKPGHDNARGDGRRLTGGKPNSTDGTVEILKQLEKEFDNLKVIYAKDCFDGKTAQCNAGLIHALDGLLWQIDSDEFYHPKDIRLLNEYMIEHPQFTEAEMWGFHFWSSTEHYCKMTIGSWGNSPPWRRVFRFTQGDRMVSHEPPQMKRAYECVLTRDKTKALGVFLYHYGYCHPTQFRQREVFYGMKQGSLTDEVERWKDGVINCPHDLEQFSGLHPIDVSPFVHATGSRRNKTMQSVSM